MPNENEFIKPIIAENLMMNQKPLDIASTMFPLKDFNMLKPFQMPLMPQVKPQNPMILQPNQLFKQPLI